VERDAHANWFRGGGWRRRAIIAFAALLVLLALFHRPVLLAVGETLVRHFVAREHLKVDLRLEGSIFSNLTVRNLHVTPTGKGPVEELDIRYARVSYSLWGVLRGKSDFLKRIEIESARMVVDPAKAPHDKKANGRDTFNMLPVLPQSARLSDVSLTIRDKPNDTVIEHLFASLDPGKTQDIRLEHLKLFSGQDFQKISAKASYTNRNLVLRDLIIGPDHFDLVNVDGSHIEQKTLPFKLVSPFGGGEISATGALREIHESAFLEIHSKATNISAASLNPYIANGVNLVGTVKSVVIEASGIVDVPKTWTGSTAVELDHVSNWSFGIDRCSLQVSAANGTATIQSGEIVQGQNQFQIEGSAGLPEEPKEFGRAPVNLNVRANAVDLKAATTGLPGNIGGVASLEGKLNIARGKLATEVVATGGPIQFDRGSIKTLKATISASRTMPSVESNEPWFRGLQTKIVFDAGEVRFRDMAIDSSHGEISSKDDLVSMDEVRIKRLSDELVMRGRYQLPGDFDKAAEQPADIDVNLNAPQLADLWIGDSPDRVFGPLQLNGQVRLRNGLADGQLQLAGSELKVRDLVIHQVSGQCSLARSVVYLNDVSIVLNAHDFVSATGQLDLKGRQAYSGKFVAQVADLSTLKPVLRKAGNQNELAGSVAINWTGKGELKSFQNTGSLQFNIDKGRYGDVQSIQSRIDSTYSPDGLDVPIIFLSSNKMVFQAIARAHGKTFEIDKIELTQDKSKYATGFLSIPFVWRNLGTRSELFPASGPVSVTFQSENLELGKLFQDLGIKSSVSGVLNLKADLHGPLDRVEGGLELHARNLRSDQVKRLQPATLDFTAQTASGQLNLAGTLQQTNIQPIELTAQVPFNLGDVLRKGGLRDDTPVTAKLRLPRSSVNFLRQFVPDVEQLDGDVGIDVDVRGTVAKPVFSGSADMTVNVARSSNVTLPALRGFKAKLDFSGDTLKVEQFGGELSGGKFTLTGGMKFHSLTKADIDLQLKADSILVARNDAVTARTNADIKVVGPLSTASVTGTVEMTNSQFLKNLDLIPIGLPGRPAPQPPSSRPDFSFPDPPIRDWKFDVAIKTKDPFLIRGNLANGGAVCDLHLVGTGLHPGLQGLIRLEHVEATLPFSRLEIAYGFLYFDPSDSLNPKMDLHGTSVIRDYTIHVYIYGTSLEPLAVFTSEPPLPQEEVISLLATGTTREELAGNNNVLASRAAMLLVQQLYRKVFKTGQGTQSSSVFDRLDVDAGQTDPRTGQQQATARFKLNNHFVLVGDVEVGGSFRGMVKYVIRFR